MIFYDRTNDTGAAAPLHVAHPLEGHQAGAAGAEVAVGSRVPVSVKCEVGSGEAGHRDAAVQDGNIRERMFLARAWGDDVTGSRFKIQGSSCCRIPTTNREFWVKKIRRNQERDEENYRLLQENGWHVIVIWECQLKPAVIEHTMREVELLLNDNLLSLYKHHTPIPYSLEEETPLPLAAEDSQEWSS